MPKRRANGEGNIRKRSDGRQGGRWAEMKIGMIDVDGHRYPNLALMKLSAWHKANGDDVEWWWGFGHYDRVYMSKVFDSAYTPDVPMPLNADEIVRGGTGYGLENRLADAM